MVAGKFNIPMSDERVIDTLLKTDFKGLPQKPGWVDGSGLSRYNLFSPQDLVFILNKMKNDFGMERIKNLFLQAMRAPWPIIMFLKVDSSLPRQELFRVLLPLAAFYIQRKISC